MRSMEAARGFCRMGIVLALALCGLPAPARAASGPAARCAAVRDDDAVRPYEPALRTSLVGAYRRLFPQAQSPPREDTLRQQAGIRCMGGRLYACFTGANLPCARMNAARDNSGAAQFCRSNPESEVVPMAATGHDTVFSYRCRAGRAVVTGQAVILDARGFATSLWTPLN